MITCKICNNLGHITIFYRMNMRTKNRRPQNMNYRRNANNNVTRNENRDDSQKENVKERVENFRETFVKSKTPASTQIWVERKKSGTLEN